jgi:hypothetical protein
MIKFLKNFKKGECIYIEDSIMWYCLEYDTDYYLSLNINKRINLKKSYYENI